MPDHDRHRATAATAADAADERLRGRTYAVPFETVWQAARSLAGGGLRGWQIREADDYEGRITAVAEPLFGAGHDVTVTIVLDSDAQTRVDAHATARKAATDFGRAARCLHRFFLHLDRAVARARNLSGMS